MKSMLSLVVLAFVVLTGALAARAQGGSEAPLTNASVVKLVRAGFSEKTLIAIIRARPARFDLAPERLIELKKGGVNERIILAMLAREQNEVLAAEGWGEDEDEFFRDGGGAKGGAQNPGSGGGVDIFGSAGGASGRSRTNGGRGGVENDTQTTGSATVRIIRPPAEAGGGPPKLERTPTLTNDSVVELVEAGFSEGTIIRRIEQSPVEFDLAPAKLDELRKRRVTEPVIAAMREAAGVEGGQPARPER